MRLLAISGSARQRSTNTALLEAMKALAPDGIEIVVLHRLDRLPVFSPDLEHDTPAEVSAFLDHVSRADGLIVASPEYVHAVPGGLKNAIDWLVSRFEIIGKPVVLAHASHRGDEMLASLRRILSTVSSRFSQDLFLRIPLIGKTPEDIAALLRTPPYAAQIDTFLRDFASVVADA
ncbi:NADPH-dependent FMN reductase [Pararobbsia silviterrae]|uniref:NAD(P)H-dependent oxidoreductase n=1 Tax=Pararobbsia silviterrae TaxID=1792498 RepID=A0A494X675_9BURK|nr:NADPH-dependent FMN reductase [Pararobbsia silviterrae]RKP46197.1 NAD(P)H-dependent oxidoreductase [Pararobbsia silviterrae]